MLTLVLPGPFDDGVGYSNEQFVVFLAVLYVIYAAAYVSPFVTALYSWFLVFAEKTNKTRVYALVSALIASGLSVLIVLWAIR